MAEKHGPDNASQTNWTFLRSFCLCPQRKIGCRCSAAAEKMGRRHQKMSLFVRVVDTQRKFSKPAVYLLFQKARKTGSASTVSYPKLQIFTSNKGAQVHSIFSTERKAPQLHCCSIVSQRISKGRLLVVASEGGRELARKKQVSSLLASRMSTSPAFDCCLPLC